ncbi:MAG TPA: universal stress protein [Blastocatellia bacterium]|nr:universal stress protein [Blastocatellia bacterium]
MINERIVFQSILCPIDLTPESDEALRYAIALAKAYEAKLLVINCTDSYAVGGLSQRAHLTSLMETAVRKHLRIPASHGFDWQAVLVDGDPKEAIAQEAAERSVDLIVMRSRRRPYAAALLGSTAESVCRTAPCPVLVTHPREQDWAGMTTNEVGLQRVLVAYDFSSDSELALAYGLSLAQEYQAEVHVLHVLPSRASRPESPEVAFLPLAGDNGFREAAVRLKVAVPAETGQWCEVKQAVREGHPYREVLAYADEQNIDLICMGASGTGFGMRALFGSNSDRVLRQAPCPVLIARPLRPAFPAASDKKARKPVLRDFPRAAREL